MFGRCGIQAGPSPSGPASSRFSVSPATLRAAIFDETRRVTFFNETRGMVLARSVSPAFTSTARRKGLLGRESLAPGEGLWIVPCEGIHTVGMRFAIDVVYLDRGCRVRKLVRNVRSWRISLCLAAHSVLELPQGAAAPEKCQVGDILSFSSDSGQQAVTVPPSSTTPRYVSGSPYQTILSSLIHSGFLKSTRKT